MQIKLLNKNEKGRTYQAEDFKILYRNKGTVAGDNEINVHEVIYFITGSAEVTLEDKTWTVQSPARVEFLEKTYHKIKALSDISFIIFEV